VPGVPYLLAFSKRQESSLRDFLQELKRRNVFRVGVAYVVIAWVLAQVAELALDSFDAPVWVMKSILLLLTLGFPLALFFAWAFELTPEGLKKEKEVDRSQSITRQTGRKLDFFIIGVLVIAVGLLLVDKFALQPEAVEPASVSAQLKSQATGDDEKSIAVIPFVDMSPAKDQEYFTDGLTENLLNALAQIGEIKVAGRTSSFAFKGRNEDLRSIGVQLNVQNILEGSVQKAGNRIRITAQLVDANDGFHLWSETFDRNLNDIFAVQDEITVAVVKALRATLLGQEVITIGYSGDFEAYNAYLRGRSYESQGTFEGWETANEQFRLAIEIDPDMALAWAGLAESIAGQTGFSTGFSEGFEQARQAAQKALDIDPELAEAHLAMAEVQRSHDWDWNAVEGSLRRALESRPGDPDIRSRLAQLMAISGDSAGALLQIDEALSRDPLNLAVQRWRTWMLVALDRNDEAVAAAQYLMEMQPDRGGSGVLLSVAHYENGQYQLALEAAQREVFPFLRLTVEAIDYYALGDKKTAEAKLAQLVKEFGDDVSYQVAAIYSLWGDTDRAFAALERGYAIRDPGLVHIQLQTAFDPIRDDPRYEVFLKKMGMR